MKCKSKRPQHPTWCVVSSYHCSRGHCLRILGSSKEGSAKKDDISVMSYHLIYLLLPIIICTCMACLRSRVRGCCIKSKVLEEHHDTMNKPTNNQLHVHFRMECRGNWRTCEPNQTITEDQYGQLSQYDYRTVAFFQKNSIK